MHDVACEFARAVVRSKDTQKQLVRTSLINILGYDKYMKGYDQYINGYDKYMKGYDKNMKGYDQYINAYGKYPKDFLENIFTAMPNEYLQSHW